MNPTPDPESDPSDRQSSLVMALSATNSSVIAGLSYFAILFAIGFLLGMIRIPVLVPRWGHGAAVAIELPIILTLAWFICRRLVSAGNVPRTVGARSLMGGLALALLLGTELALSTIVFSKSLTDVGRSSLSLHQALGLAGQIAFGIFPLIQLTLTIRSIDRAQRGASDHADDHHAQH